ncbi:hypothetical protein RHGRI_032521 [Rhododendron griersonianum]|uniref:Uncharacterized protein n=1 Tax=Rhododendron griersonianum TaxID=479676 RepID=A0AAV6IHZ4_9ERIC|nr:hypothetical protein RHGRI_032521 [Rhododendron griersonianum]
MGTSSITLSPPHSLSSFPKTIFHSSNPPQNFTILQFQLRRLYPRVQASRRISNFPQVGLGIEDYADGDDDDDEEEQEEDRSLDLLVKFVENVFKKVGFSVNGVILLAFLWILKAFLEVVCTIGSAVFVSILLIRGIWSGLSYLQQSRNYRANEYDDDNHAWTGARPVS